MLRNAQPLSASVRVRFSSFRMIRQPIIRLLKARRFNSNCHSLFHGCSNFRVVIEWEFGQANKLLRPP